VATRPSLSRARSGAAYAGSRLVTAIGASRLGPPAVRVLGSCSRGGLVPAGTAAAVLGRLVHRPADQVIDVTRSFGGAPARLLLDLSYSGCRDLLLAYWNFLVTSRPAGDVLSLATEAGVAVTDGASSRSAPQPPAGRITRPM
jgi:hypothetical protein